MLRFRTIPGLMRRHDGQSSSRVTFLELFFDLVFLFAITQLSHTLLGDFTVRGALEAGMLLMATWWVWIHTTWTTNWLDPNTSLVGRMLVGLMFGSLLLSTSISDAFGDYGLLFAAAYVFVQVSRSVFLTMAFGERGQAIQANFYRITLWFLASAPFWVAGGFAEGDTRLVLWALALAIDYVGPAAGYPFPRLGRTPITGSDISPAHMAERCGLFVIIVLGESFLVAGLSYVDLERTFAVNAAFLMTFVTSVTLWWIYFGTIADEATRHFEENANPERMATSAYTYLHLPIVAGIIVIAVGDELVLAHPDGSSDMQTVLTVVGGPMLFLVGTLLFRIVSAVGRFPISHVVGLALLAVVLTFAGEVSPLVLSWLSTATLIVVGALESMAGRTQSLQARRTATRSRRRLPRGVTWSRTAVDRDPAD